MEKNLIKLNKVSKVFKVGEENFTALHEVSLEIERGAFMSFVGPSGSGKTTLLNLIGGLDVPTSGDIYFKESGLLSMSRQQMAQYRRENIGFIFQTYNLLPVYSVYENVLFPLLLKYIVNKYLTYIVYYSWEHCFLKTCTYAALCGCCTFHSRMSTDRQVSDPSALANSLQGT